MATRSVLINISQQEAVLLIAALLEYQEFFEVACHACTVTAEPESVEELTSFAHAAGVTQSVINKIEDQIKEANA